MRSIPILLLLWASAALGQPYPARPVKIMAGASPGGGIDIISRLLADKFAERFKQPFVVENRPGASNTLAADFTARAAPDGHTLMVATNTGQAIAPHLIKLGFDAQKDIQPVGLVVVVPNVVVVNTGVPARSIEELLALLKARPGEYRFASVGVGSTPRPVVERLNAELQKALQLPDVRARLAGLGGEPGALSVQQFTEMNTAEYERFGRLIREAAIRIDG